MSYRIALKHSTREWAPSYCVVRYEDLVDNAPTTMARIVQFLDIQPAPIVLRPTVAGSPSTANSSFVTDGPRGEIVSSTQPDVLSRPEQMLAAAWVGRLARPLGYHVAAFGARRSIVRRVS